MAYMGGGIADMLGAVDKTAGVFAGNPQKLKQKAGPNLSQDLISALALQKITSEKAAAERDMQMQMEQAKLQLVNLGRQRDDARVHLKSLSTSVLKLPCFLISTPVL